MIALLASVAIRASLLLAVSLAAVRALRGSSASMRRAVLAFAFLSVTVLPVATTLLPVLHLGRASSIASTVPTASVPDTVVDASAATPTSMAFARPASHQSLARQTPSTSPVSVPLVALTLWLLGAAAMIGRVVVGHLRARRIARTGVLVEKRTVQKRGSSRVVHVRASAAIDTPAVTGVFSPVVLLPREYTEWTAERYELVLAHELAHVTRRDCMVNALAQIARALHWFNPLAWFAARQLRIESELAADAAVVDSGARASSYAEHLLALATVDRDVPAGALAMADPSQIEQRIRALLAPTHGAESVALSRAATTRTRNAALLAGGAALAAFVACASPDPAPAPTTPPDVATKRQTAVTQTAPVIVEDHPAQALAESVRSIASIDPAVQSIIDDEHDKLVAQWTPCASVIIVLDPQTGRVVGLSARGGTEQTAELAAQRAITPGSTVKPLVIAAALDEGVITTTEKFDATPQTAPEAPVIHDSEPHGLLTAREILAVSSNVGLAKVFHKMGGDDLRQWHKRFHLAFAPPVIPDDNLGAAIAFGANIRSTPLEMTAAFAVLANGGVYHAPTFDNSTGAGERVVRTATASTVLDMLESVTTKGGTGTAAHIDGVRVAGKTGTANLNLPESDDYYSSFVGTAPIEHPRYVVYVGAETPRDGGTGGQVAAPAFGHIMARLLAR
ncbi:MAG TPA: penicillin-binding transpeptidase domain-containing protein [Kofleriaceae bacterium]|jgi:cell division protein FtsI (penicillin-binding protein 3)